MTEMRVVKTSWASRIPLPVEEMCIALRAESLIIKVHKQKPVSAVKNNVLTWREIQLGIGFNYYIYTLLWNHCLNKKSPKWKKPLNGYFYNENIGNAMKNCWKIIVLFWASGYLGTSYDVTNHKNHTMN